MRSRLSEVTRRAEEWASASGASFESIPLKGAEAGIIAMQTAPPRFRAKQVLIVAGTHGNEPAGVEAVLEFLESQAWKDFPRIQLTIYPCLNPCGYQLGTRENGHGHDINRSFRGNGTAESRKIRASLAATSFDYFLDLHEDLDQTGFYLYEIADGPLFGETVVEAVSGLGPVLAAGTIDGEMHVTDGVVQSEQPNLEEAMARMKDWPLPFYLRANGARRGLVPETPGKLHLDQRVAMQLAALHKALELVSGER